MDSLSTIWALASNNLKGRYRSIIIWGVALGALGAMYVALYPLLADQLNELMKQLPENMRGAFSQFSGGNITIQQWMQLEFLNVLIPVALPIMVILIGARTIVGSEERKTLDMLMSGPIKRSQVVAGSIVTMALALVCVFAITWIITYIAVPIAGVDLGPGALAKALAALWPFCMMFGVLSLLLSGLVRRNAFAVAIPLVIIVATYVLNSLYQSSQSLKSVRYFSLLYYLGQPLSGDFAWIATISVLAATCILGALAILAFDRRDIYT